jgi:hypothetical protein
MCGWDQEKDRKVDCGKCNCIVSDAQHNRVKDPDSPLYYCTKCNEYC